MGCSTSSSASTKDSTRSKTNLTAKDLIQIRKDDIEKEYTFGHDLGEGTSRRSPNY